MPTLQEIKTILLSLITKLSQVVYKSEITNLPEVQKVELTNPPEKIVIPEFPKIEFPEIRIDYVVEAIKNKVIPLDETATKKQLLKELEAIKKAVSKPEKDRTDEILKAITKVVSSLVSLKKEDKEVDLSPIVKAIKQIDTKIDWSPLEKFTTYNDLNIKINSKQFETLIKALGKSIAVAVGGGGSSSSSVTDVSALATSAKQDTLLAELQLKADLTETQPVSVASLPLPSGAATAANQQTDALTDTELRATPVPVSGTFYQATQPVSIASMPSTPVTGTFWQATQPVSLASVPSHAVTNAGTFVVQENGGALTALQIIDDWDETDRAKVNLIVGQAGITAGAGAVAANTPRVTHASDDPVTTAVQLINDAIKADDAAFTPATTKVMMAGFEADETTTDSVDEGDAGAARMTLDRKQIVTIQPHTAGGWSVMNATSGDTYTALTSTAQVIKASAGNFGGYYIYNPNTAAIYVHVYNIAAASVTVGTSTATLTFCIPAGAAANLELVNGISFSTAMSWAATTTGGGNTAPTTALEAMCWYK